ncbi:hypothetical protein [Pseudomonas oryzae]|uniref:Uncharacterized protein n=1 Tax=Pseudomonas oryzae TaxID=1392877 RepID=A0A1H1LAB3_9PSED|nr:hypothetical protein [Pseudomonas oryzae]SDR71446.1 hypothetical protein SAMN05216221_0076 [Pseudomonas oryzae]
MLWPTTKKPSTRELLRTEHRLHAVRAGRPWQWAVFLVFCLVSAALWWRLDDGRTRERQLAALAAENRSLKAALEQSRLQQDEALATEAQLMRRIEEMSAQVKRLKTELAFFRQQKKSH